MQKISDAVQLYFAFRDDLSSFQRATLIEQIQISYKRLCESVGTGNINNFYTELGNNIEREMQAVSSKMEKPTPTTGGRTG